MITRREQDKTTPGNTRHHKATEDESHNKSCQFFIFIHNHQTPLRWPVIERSRCDICCIDTIAKNRLPFLDKARPCFHGACPVTVFRTEESDGSEWILLSLVEYKQFLLPHCSSSASLCIPRYRSFTHHLSSAVVCCHLWASCAKINQKFSCYLFFYNFFHVWLFSKFLILLRLLSWYFFCVIYRFAAIFSRSISLFMYFR